jgi:hypothetical protein
MPRAQRPKSITLHLPPPPSQLTRRSTANDGSQSIADQGQEERVEPFTASNPSRPALEVLLQAQIIARRRGHRFDILSFCTPQQRVEYLAILHENGYSSPSRGPGSTTPTDLCIESVGITDSSSTYPPSASMYVPLSKAPHQSRKRNPFKLSQIDWRKRQITTVEEPLKEESDAQAANKPTIEIEINGGSTPKAAPGVGSTAASSSIHKDKAKGELSDRERAGISDSASYW